MMVFRLQLIGGPDDGSIFDADILPPQWEMLKAVDRVRCHLLGALETPYVDVYYRSDDVSEKGHVLYYHERMRGTCADGVAG